MHVYMVQLQISPQLAEGTSTNWCSVTLNAWLALNSCRGILELQILAYTVYITRVYLLWLTTMTNENHRKWHRLNSDWSSTCISSMSVLLTNDLQTAVQVSGVGKLDSS